MAGIGIVEPPHPILYAYIRVRLFIEEHGFEKIKLFRQEII